MTTATGHSTDTPDAELVAQSLAGSRDAFRKIVERHQTLVCSLAYCATGNLSQSEDLAQETFLAAWQQLPGMREPSKLRSWLCAIARFVIGKELRRRGRQPLHDAVPLETTGELRANELPPSDRAVANEEEAILWHCVARIPEMYREPLVLFYREHQSVEGVAEALGLGKDAVKQRLARGRRLLHKEVRAYVEAALQNTRPGKAFTGAVLAALPPSAFPAKILALGAAKTSTLKTVGAMAAVGLVILYWSFLGFLVFVGGCAGYWMRRSCARSPDQCRNVIRFWRILARTLAACAVIRELLAPGLLLAACPWIRELLPPYLFPWWYSGRGWLVSRFVLDFALVVIIADLAMLAWPGRRDLAGQASQARESFPVLKTRLRRWVLLGMIVPALWFIPTVGDFLGQKLRPPQHLSHADLRKIVGARKDADYVVVEDNETKTKTLRVVLPENNPGSIQWRADNLPDWWKRWTRGARPSWWNLWMGDSVPGWVIWTMYWTGWRPVQMVAPADEWSLKLLDDAGIHPHYGRRSNTWADIWPFWRWMPLFILPMGITILSRRIGPQSTTNAWPNSEQLMMETQTGGMVLALHGDPKARRVFRIAFGIAFALAFTANALTAFGIYVLLLVGTLKGTFFGLIAGIGVLHLRSRRKVRMESD